MERKKYVIFTAAGSGTRMKASEPKQFLLLDGLPVLHRSIFAFLDACPDVKVITVLPKEHVARWEVHLGRHRVGGREGWRQV